MEKTNQFLTAVARRRSCYALNGQSPLNPAQIEHLVRECVKQVPSAFNSQSARVLVLFHEQHHQFWKLTLDVLRDKIPAGKFAPTQEKIASFDAAFGTLLYFEEWKRHGGFVYESGRYSDVDAGEGQRRKFQGCCAWT